MVKVREDQPQFKDGTVDIEAWYQSIVELMDIPPEKDVLVRAARISRVAEEQAIAAENIWAEGTSSFRTGLEMTQILASLNLDQDSLVAATIYRSVREGKLKVETVKDQFGPSVMALVDGVLQMAAIHHKHRATNKSVLGQQAQPDNVRKMLVSMIDDVRVALIKIAERTCAIRAVKNAPSAKRYRVAREVSAVYAPLAHRLGIGHLKWELEDLSFRYLEASEYKRIAKLLDEKRLDREQYIDDVLKHLNEQMANAHIMGADITGRVKHIYSIWRKMTRKGISFSQVYDIRAVRILVPEVADCYSVLGIIHSTWRTITGEFDDYIGSPKPNGYQSLHTAVIGPEGKALEIQIRTFNMHEEAELGVCAHWKYKGTDTSGKDDGYEQKLQWLRSVLEWREEVDNFDDIAEDLEQEISEERIYVLTPYGHVVDLPNRATPIDFAYKVHTEVGHACRGARINSKMSKLNTPLKNGDQVEIMTTKTDIKPSRDWLNTELGYLVTNSARAKVKLWFKNQNRDANLVTGKEILHKQLSRFGLTGVDLPSLLEKLSIKSEEELYLGLATTDVKIMSVIKLAEADSSQSKEDDKVKIGRLHPVHHGDQDLYIHGVGNLMTQIAGCCQPVPGDEIMGFITQGRGVSIHRCDCVNLLQLENTEPEKIIEVQWGVKQQNIYPVDLRIEAYDRQGLLKDIMLVMANMGINIVGMNTHTDVSKSTAEMTTTIEIESLDNLHRIMNRINNLPNVLDVKRVTKH
jgi:GTP pyrophosphokinase